MNDIDVQIVATPPRVFLVGRTMPVHADGGGFDAYLRYRGATWNSDPVDADAEAIAEAAGRVCYQSWTNLARRSREDYLQDAIIGHGHGSVLEHVWLNVLIADLPRSTQLELVRHGEGTAFSFESQRFTDRSLRFIAPPAIRGNQRELAMFSNDCLSMKTVYLDLVKNLTDQFEREGRYGEDATLRRKRVKEAARAMLPNCVGADGMVSVNARALRHIVQMRSDIHADASIREFAAALFTAAQPAIPAILADAHPGDIDMAVPAIVFEACKV